MYIWNMKRSLKTVACGEAASWLRLLVTGLFYSGCPCLVLYQSLPIHDADSGAGIFPLCQYRSSSAADSFFIYLPCKLRNLSSVVK